MFFNIGAPEVAMILFIALFVFGPSRLPEMMRKAGNAVARLKAATSEATREWKEPLDEIRAPLEEIRREGRAIRSELTSAAADVAQGVNETRDGISRGLNDAVARPQRDLKAELDKAKQALQAKPETKSRGDDL